MTSLFRGWIVFFVVMALGCQPASQPAGDKPAEQTAPVVQEKAEVAPIEFSCPHPVTEEAIALSAVLPQGWQRNMGFGTVVYEPANAGDYYEAPHIEFQARVEGEAAPEAIPGNIDRLIANLKEGWKTLATGDPELDQKGANVDIIKEEKSDGEWLFEVKLTYPEGVSEAMYPPRYYVHRFLHNAGDDFFIHIKGSVPVKLADEFLAPVEAACQSTKRL